MKSFTIKKLARDLEIESFEYDIKGFIYKPKNKNYKVKEVIIVNPEITSALISYSFYKNYKKILELYLKSLQEDDEEAESGLLIALDEVARLKNIITSKYKTLLKKKEVDKFLKQLKILETEIKNKIVDIALIKEQKLANINTMEEKKGMSR